MDALAWIVIAAAGTAAAAVIVLAPRWKRDNLRRQLEGGGGSLGGVGAGFDAVWRPSADEVAAQWQTEIELPAPAPSPADRGHLGDGRIVIDVRDAR
jgi:hypothetical protein